MASNCDFCNQPDPQWRYTVTDFVVPEANWKSTGNAYHVCQECYELIEKDNRKGLFWRMLTHFLETNRPVDEDMALTIRSLLFAQNMFFTYRENVPPERL